MHIPEVPLVNENCQPLVLTVRKDMSVLDVIHQMSQVRTSCALILEQEKLVGIFTEQHLFQRLTKNKELLSDFANQTALTDVTVGELMTQCVITLSQTNAENLPTVVQTFRQHDISHLPILDSRGKVVRVVTWREVIDKLCQTIDVKTAELATEVAQRQQMSELLVQKEASYQASQARINDIVDSAIATSIVSFRVFPNRDWQYDYQSIGCEVVFGYTPQEILSDQYLWMSRVHPEDRETVIMPLFEEIFAERTVTVEYRFQHKDNSLRWISATYTSRYDAAANCWIVTGISIDITDRKHMEEALRESEERWHLAIAGTNEAIWDWNIITNQTFRSDRWFEILGYQREELSNCDDEWSIRIHPDDYERVIAAQQAYLQRQASDYNVEYRLRRRDENYRWFRSRAKAVWDEQGNPVRLVGSLADISDRKFAELALQEREAILRRIGDNLPNGAIYKVIRELDGRNRFSYLSAGFERLMEVKVEDALRDSSLLYSQLLPEDIPRFQAAAEESRANLSVYDIQLRFRTPSGQFKWLHFRSTPSCLEDGRIAWDGLVVDVTNFKHTEETLRQKEEQLRLTLEFNRIGTWDWNLQTEEVIWNDNHFRLLGLEPRKSEMDYQLWRNCVHPEDIERVEQAVFTALREHTNFEAEYRIVYPDNRVRWITGKGRAIYNEAGEPVRMLGVMIDISDRKLAEQALQEKETFLRSIYNGVGQAIFVIDVVDNDFRYVNFNPTAEKSSGLRTQQVQGKTLEQIFPPTVAAVTRQHYQDCINARETITYEESLPFNDIETWWVTSLTPLKDENSRIYRIVGNSVNISDRKQAEHILELQAVITRNMAEGICLVRVSDGIMVYANPKFEQMFGYETGELIGQHVSIVNYVDDEDTTPEEIYQTIRAAVLQHGEATYEVHNVKKDGTPFWCSGTVCVFEHPEYGNVFVAVQQDITEHKQAEEQIKASLKEKEVLLKEIHHRVKNNLGIVSSLLQMQCRRTQDSQATAILRDSQNRIASIALVHEKLYRSEDLANIAFAQYLPDLITHLFDSYNVSSGSVQLSIKVDDVNLDIETAIPCGLIINELVSNALKYAFPDHRHAKIQLHLYQECKFSLDKQQQRNLILIVRDNGVGLPADFEHNKTKTLGITLVYGLVKQLKGKIEINSQIGTEFKITFSTNRI